MWQAMDGVWSIGPSAEFFLNDNLSFSTGVHIAQQRAENHQNCGDSIRLPAEILSRRTGLPCPNATTRLMRSGFRHRRFVFQYPVHLNYYAPLRCHWLLAFSVGTLLGMSVYQAVQFESYYAGSEQFSSFEVNARNKVFHNLVFGTGLHYQRGRLSARMTPLLLYDFRETNHSTPGGKLVLKGSVWLNLYR